MKHLRQTRARATQRLLTGLIVLGAMGAMVVPAAGFAGASFSAMAHPNLLRAQVSPQAVSCATTSLCPSMVRTAYEMGSLLTNSSTNGTGQTVVIVDACGDSAIASDLSTFDSTFGLPGANLTVYQPQGTPCSNPTGWGLETALDVEWAHVMAPGASIALVEAKSASTANLFGAWNYSLTHHLGNVISNSWGGSGGCPNVARNLLTTATKQHVTILASAGDSGAWGSGTLARAQQPADCQAVVTVGGTTLKVNSTGAYQSESAWSGTGGGYVGGTKEPAYQKTANITDKYGELAKPDVAAIADPNTGVWVYENGGGGWYIVGGTSVACPLWAGYLADVNSWRASLSLTALGSLNGFLYAKVYGVNGGSTNYANDIHDVQQGTNGWSAGTGWDAATGIGSPHGYALASLLGTNPSA